jgi:hypothetical protein
LPVREADSDIIEDWVVVRTRGGLVSKSRFGSVGCCSGAAAEFDRVYGGNVVAVVLRERLATDGTGTLSPAMDGSVGFESELTRLG